MIEYLKKVFPAKVVVWFPLFVIFLLLILFRNFASESNNYLMFRDFNRDSLILNSNFIIILLPHAINNVSLGNVVDHNKDLISTLKERESSHIYSIESQVESLRQTRTIYIIIIGVILTVLLRIYGKKSDEKYKKKRIIIILLVFLILLFYFLDVNQEDLLMRSQKSKSVTAVTLNSLINQDTKNNTWYKIDYIFRDLFLGYLEESSQPRKIFAMFQKPCPEHFKLNLIQLALYIIPLIIVYISFIILLYNQNKLINVNNKNTNNKKSET